MSVPSSLLRIWYAVVVAIVLQSVWIGGGFGSDREIVEFMAKYGYYGWIAILISVVTLIIVLIPSLELARVFGAYDYMTWSKQFLWRAWPILDIVYIVMAWIVIAVVGAAAGYMLSDMIGVPFIVSAAVVIIVVGVLHFFGRRIIEAFWIIGTVGLYAMYFILWGYMLATKGGEAFGNISAGLHRGTPLDAAVDGFKYMLYNLVVVFPH